MFFLKSFCNFSIFQAILVPHYFVSVSVTLFGFFFSSNGNSIALPTPPDPLYLPSGELFLHQHRGFHFPSSLIHVPCRHVPSSHSSWLPYTNAADWTCGIAQHVAQRLCILAVLRLVVLQGTTMDIFYGELKGWELLMGIISLLPPLPICWCWSFSYSHPERLMLNMSSFPHLNQLFPEDLGYPGPN